MAGVIWLVILVIYGCFSGFGTIPTLLWWLILPLSLTSASATIEVTNAAAGDPLMTAPGAAPAPAKRTARFTFRGITI